jgi:uncharacterized membrane protein
MIYRFINSLPRTWRYRTQRLWMHTRNLRNAFWRQSPALLFQAAFVVPLVGLLLLWTLVRLAPLLAALLLAYGLFLLLLSGCRALALWMGR